MAKLLGTLENKVYGRGGLRSQRLVMIFTPGQMTLGYTVKDSQQGWVLFGLTSTSLGKKALKTTDRTKV